MAADTVRDVAVGDDVLAGSCANSGTLLLEGHP
jgi:hypothetical protein